MKELVINNNYVLELSFADRLSTIRRNQTAIKWYGLLDGSETTFTAWNIHLLITHYAWIHKLTRLKVQCSKSIIF